jgi:hypothetical protein
MLLAVMNDQLISGRRVFEKSRLARILENHADEINAARYGDAED